MVRTPREGGQSISAGDKVLIELSSRLKQHIRSMDLPCRVGGEEFLIVLPDTDMVVARQIGERLRMAICGSPFDAGPTAPQLSVTVSIGVAEFEDSSDTLANMLQRADEALYRAKREGRNRVISEAA